MSMAIQSRAAQYYRQAFFLACFSACLLLGQLLRLLLGLHLGQFLGLLLDWLWWMLASYFRLASRPPKMEILCNEILEVSQPPSLSARVSQSEYRNNSF